MAWPAEVERTLDLVVDHLGAAFSFDHLTLFTATCRNKVLKFEQDLMPVGITGCCIALADTDLIVTRRSLDKILTQTVKLHEIGHLLLQHVPILAMGQATPSYALFKQRRPELKVGVIYRSHISAYRVAQEFAAETFATALLECILRYETSMPYFGWEVDPFKTNKERKNGNNL